MAYREFRTFTGMEPAGEVGYNRAPAPGVRLVPMLAFFAAADKPLDPNLAASPYAEAGARRLSETLAAVGYDESGQVHLFGSRATLAVVRSRLKRFLGAAAPGDTLFVHLAARTLGAHLGFWDTHADDPAETAIPVTDLIRLLESTRAARVLLSLDTAVSEELHAGLTTALAGSAKIVALAACSPGEESLAAAPLKATAWAHLLAEAFAGRLPKALDKSGAVTARGLLRAVEDDMPRLLRKQFDALADQTPQLHGGQNAAEEFADLAGRAEAATGNGLLTAERLKRVAFRADTAGRAKDLQGFRKTFSVPENNSPSNRKFIARLAQPDITEDLNSVVAAAREHLGYKRKDIDLIADGDGVGTVRTPDFEYTVTAGLDPDDPSRVAWRRECAQFADPEFVRGDGFDAVFGKLFDQLAFEFARPVDVPALVDRVEESPPKGVKISVSADGNSCDIALAGFAGRVVVEPTSLTVRGRAGNAAGLLDQFLAFTTTVGPLGEPLALR